MTETRRELMSIGEFAAASRLSPKALRIYDKKGILPPAFIDPESGYRYYRQDQLEKARLVRMLRQMDMPLSTIREVVEAEPDQVSPLIWGYASEYSSKFYRTQQLIGQVISSVSKENSAMSFQVEAVNIDPQQIVSITSRVRVQGLDIKIKSDLMAVRSFIEEQGGTITNPPLGIYHGSINNESDGPIEVCVPAEGRFIPQGDIVVRELAGGRGVRAIARGDQCVFPAILGAYDAVVDWIHSQGHEMLGSPREVWVSRPEEEAEMHIVWLYR